MKRHIFIINPEAGKKKGEELTGIIEKYYNDPVILRTEYPGHATKLAQDYSGPATAIYALGGDGTFNEVINGVLKSEYAGETAVANVPCGSGNDFIGSISDIKDPEILLERYKEQRTRRVDAGRLNGRYFMNISSVGFDAEIVLNAKKYKRLPMLNAELAYVISVFATLIHLKGYELEVSIDGGPPVSKSILFMVMANGNYYGGGMKAAPEAQLEDGLLNFGIVDCVKRRQVPFLLPRFMKGDHDGLDVLTKIPGKAMRVTSEKPVPVNIDGEIVLGKEIDVYLEEKVLLLLVPLGLNGIITLDDFESTTVATDLMIRATKRLCQFNST